MIKRTVEIIVMNESNYMAANEMSIFGSPQAGDFPRQWKDMSLDFKLMFVFHGCMMILFIIGSAFSVRQELAFTAAPQLWWLC